MSYPNTNPSAIAHDDRTYQDREAAALYVECGASTLPAIHTKLMRALDAQAAKIELYSSTKYSRDHAELVTVTTRAIAEVETQIELWHFLIFPNQRPEGT